MHNVQGLGRMVRHQINTGIAALGTVNAYTSMTSGTN